MVKNHIVSNLEKCSKNITILNLLQQFFFEQYNQLNNLIINYSLDVLKSPQCTSQYSASYME